MKSSITLKCVELQLGLLEP